MENYIKAEDRNRGKQFIKKFNEIVYGQDTLNWDVLYKIMNDLYDGLFDQLRDKYSELDEDEFRICCLTYSKFRSSEIAVIMKLGVNTIQMKRSSIRKKTGIPPNGSISKYLNEALSIAQS